MSEIAQARTRLLRAAVTQGHVWGPISQNTGRYTATCKRCSRGWVSGPTEHESELTPCTGLRSTSAAGLACVVPGCARQATHTVSWNHRPTGKAEAVHACEPCGRKLLYGARRSKNFRTPSITPVSPQRQKAGAVIRCPDCGGTEQYPGEHQDLPALHGTTRVHDENAEGGRMWMSPGGMNYGHETLVTPDPDHPGFGNFDTRRLKFDQSHGGDRSYADLDHLVDSFKPLRPSLNNRRAAFEKFQHGIDSLLDRARAQGHLPKVAWGQTLRDNAGHTEQHTIMCRNCRVKDKIVKQPDGTWKVTMGKLVNEPCASADVTAVRKVAHDSGDGETIYHCGRGSERYWTRDGIKTLGETVGTVQWVLTNTGSGGVWREAMIHSFGEQPLLKVTLKRGKQTKVTHWTPEHRWLVRVRQDPTRAESRMVTTADLKPGDALSWLLPKSRIGTSSPSQFGIAHGITYGDGTRAALGATLNLWGEKDAQLLRYFSESPQSIVKTAKGVLGVHVTGLPAFFKERPSLDESIPYLYGWLAGYFAADGCVSDAGQVILDSASQESLEYVQTLAARLGIATNDISMKVRQGYGDEPSTIYQMSFIASTLRPDFFLIKEHRERFQVRLDRGITEKIGWVVESVEDEGLVEEVFCPRVPDTENFVLESWINTANCPFCGSGQVIARSDRTIECEFCHTAFTVQVQPELSAFPQTVNGAPVQVPGMPGEIGSDALDQPDDMSAQPPGADPMDPTDLADEEQPGDDQPMSPDDLAGDDEDDEDQQSGGGFSGQPSAQNQPPWLKGNPTKRSSLATLSGATLSEDDMVRRLALRHTEDRGKTLEAVRGNR